MDLAYDYITEQTYAPGERASTPTAGSGDGTSAAANDAGTPKASGGPPRENLQTELQETFKAFSNSPWGAKLGGFWGNVKKQSETYIEEARKEAAEVASEVEALRTKGLLGLGFGKEKDKKEDGPSGESSKDTAQADPQDREKRDIQETETFLARFKSEAAKRLKDVQKAEDAADEALLRFGTNIRNFLRDAVAVKAPDEEEETHNRQPGEVLFESKDPTSGKRVIHTSRFDAQLHVIHTNLTSFTQDPSGAGGQWDDFKKEFDIDKMTARIAEDLDKYSELRQSMEKLVPERVDYKDFWTRYYFLRHVVEVQEEKRKELLRGWYPVGTPSNDQALTYVFSQQHPHTIPRKLAGMRIPMTSKALHPRHNCSRTSSRQKSWLPRTPAILPPRFTRRLLRQSRDLSSLKLQVADLTMKSRSQIAMLAMIL
ncbi:hypothetical protein HRR86_005674 [Exophiala dermatitidis]|nr:hypothetical protein HRR76_008386 [Exophiala dermatitidis]KAJ4616559.1 hypothetical protein HRR85_003401 [Exophiala dermatitidis]KAJ4622728.1 hypothetical protein HRR86_005674 [Exophiala dermatitidis]